MKVKKSQLEELARQLRQAMIDVQAEQDEVNKGLAINKRLQKFQKERRELLAKNSKKDEQGNPITKVENNIRTYEIEDMVQHNKEYNNLLKRFKKELDERTKFEIEYNKKLEQEEVEININLLDNTL